MVLGMMAWCAICAIHSKGIHGDSAQGSVQACLCVPHFVHWNRIHEILLYLYD